MAESAISFIVQFVPPSRPPSAPAIGHGIVAARRNAPPRQMRLGFDPNDTFAQVWNKIKTAYDTSYPEHEREFTCFTRLQSPLDVDIILSSTVGSLFNKQTPLQERTIYVQQTYLDHESSIAPGSALQPTGWKRKLFTDLTPDKQATLKRRRLEEGRYGSALDSLDADTPVESRERPGGGLASSGHDDEGEQKIDKDGFKLPKKIVRPAPRAQVALKRGGAEAEESQATVLVEDSQPQEGLADPSSLSALQQRRAASHHHRAHPGADKTSPAEDAAFRASTLGPGVRPTNLRLHNLVSNRTPGDAGARRGTIPTPDSNERNLLNNEAPTSAQRSRSGGTSTSASSRRFIPLQNEQADNDLAIDDPIEDDDIIHAVNDENLDDLRQSRGRTRSRSLESTDGQPRLDSSALPVQRPTVSLSRTNTTAFDSTPFTDPPSSNPLDQLRSSQRASAKREPSRPWTLEEDQTLIQGHQKGLNNSQIAKAYGMQRSDSALRNRYRMLTLNNDNLPSSDDIPVVNPSYLDPRVSQHSKARAERWSQPEIAKLRKAMGYGLDIAEMRVHYFPNRTEEGIRKKERGLRDAVFNFEKKTPTYPNDEIEIEGWEPKHDLQLRRAYLDPEMDGNQARERFFMRFPVGTIQKKMIAYNAQMDALGVEPNVGLSPQKSAKTGLNHCRPASVDEDGTLIETSSRNAQRMDDPSSELFSTSPVSSSPPIMTDAPPTQNPAVVAPKVRKRGAESMQNTLSDSNNQQAARRPSCKITPQRSNGGMRQTTLGFQVDKRKKRAGPPRPTNAELDALYSRRLTRPDHVQDGANGRPASRNAPGAPVEREIIHISSGAEVSPDTGEGDSEFDEVNDFEMLEAHVNSQSQADQGAELQSPGEEPSRNLDEPMLLDGLRKQIAAESVPEFSVTQPSVSIPVSTEASKTKRSHISKSQAVETPTTAQIPDRPQSHRGELPSVGGPAARYFERNERHLRQIREQTTGTSESHSQVPLPASATKPSSNTAASETAKTPARRLPLGQLSAQSTTQSQSQPQPMSRAAPVGEVEPWIPFEERSRSPGGTVNVGRRDHEHFMKLPNTWVRTESELYAKAKRRAKQDWIHDEYERLKLEQLQNIRMAGGDFDDLKRLRQKQLKLRAVVRRKMGLPPLESLRRVRPGEEVVLKKRTRSSDDESGTEYDPEDDEDDNLDLLDMLKDEYREQDDPGSDGSEESEESYPGGVDRDRHFEEVQDDEFEDVEAMDLDDRRIVEAGMHAKDGELPTALPNVTKPKRRPSTAPGLKAPQSPNEIEVYDGTRDFLRTRSLPAGSISPIVQPTQGNNSPVKSKTDKAIIAADELEMEPPSGSMSDGSSVDASDADPAPGAHDTLHDLVSGVKRSAERMLAGIKANGAKILEENAQAKKRKQDKRTLKERYQLSDVARSATSAEEEPEMESEQRKRSLPPDTDEDEDAPLTKKTKASDPVSKPSRRTAIPDSQEETQSDYDRLAMPPPSISLQQQDLSLQRQDSFTSSNMTSGSDRSKRSLRRSRHRHRRTLDPLHSDSVTSSDAIIVTTPPHQSRNDNEDSDEDEFLSPVTAPETQEETQMVMDSIESQPLTVPLSSPPLAQSHTTTTNGTQKSTTAPRKSLGERFKSVFKMPTSFWIPPPPKVREEEVLVPVKMPYGSDEEDSSSNSDED